MQEAEACSAAPVLPVTAVELRLQLPRPALSRPLAVAPTLSEKVEKLAAKIAAALSAMLTPPAVVAVFPERVTLVSVAVPAAT